MALMGLRTKETGEVAGSRRSRGLPGWIDSLYAWRDRLFGSPSFQRFAAGFPLTRPVARRQAAALFDICAGFVYSQVLAACVELDLFALLRERPQTARTLSDHFAIPPEAMERLLNAAVSLKLLSNRSGGRYGLGMAGAALAGNPGIAAMVKHHRMLYADLRDPLKLLRGGNSQTELSRYWPYAGQPPADSLKADSVSDYTALMSASQGLIAEDILQAYDFGRHAHLLDVGGGDGAFLEAAAKAVPPLRLTLFDVPAVAAIARRRFEDAGLSHRAQAYGGNFLEDALPPGADLIALIRILLDYDDATVLRILRAARKAIAPGGTLLIAEPVSGLTGAPRITDAYFGLYLLAMGRGRPRSFAALKQLLHEAGFGLVRSRHTRRPMLINLLTAKPDL
jgi:demethylspheroidene O-methyltransferase